MLSWTMCDVVRWGGCTARRTAQKVALLKQKVQDKYVQAVLLQEVCQSTLNELLTQLGPGWSANCTPYHWSEKGKLSVSPCETKPGRPTEPLDPHDDVGTAIVVKAGLPDPVKHPMLQPSTALVPPFQCATADYFELRLCNVHSPQRESDNDFPALDHRDDYQLAVKDIVEDYPKVVFGGDFTPGRRTRALSTPRCGSPRSRTPRDRTHRGTRNATRTVGLARSPDLPVLASS
ncbi:hypothetical protein ACIQM0_38675 [Streptomyces sp. NPDC091387]|uniref:hypothetical protein n=1 Tax=Streptomyces sp. NPDC091387 TaxID=3365998 RepID=UPI0037FD9228